MLVKTKAPSFQKEVQHIFLSQILTDLKKKIWSLPFQPRVLNRRSWITLGQMHSFFQFRGYWQVAHKWRFMRHLSVSPMPKSGKTVHLPQINSTPSVKNSIPTPIRFPWFSQQVGTKRNPVKTHLCAVVLGLQGVTVILLVKYL